MGPALEHYRCIQCLMSKTHRVRVSDTVQFFPHSIPFPKINLNDRLLTALNNIISTLSSKQFQTDNPSLNFDDQTILAIKVVANMLHRDIPKPPLPLPSKIQLPPLNKPITHPTQLLRVLNATKTLQEPEKDDANGKSMDKIISKLLHIYNKQTGKKEIP